MVSQLKTYALIMGRKGQFRVACVGRTRETNRSIVSKGEGYEFC